MYFQQNITLKSYIEDVWLPRKKNEVKISTYARYEGLTRRIIEYLGNEEIAKMKPADIYYFYDELRECCSEHCVYIPTELCVNLLKKNYTRPQTVKLANIGLGTVDALRAGKAVKITTAERISKLLKLPKNELFTMRSSPLSTRTIHHYHALLFQICKEASYDEVIADNFMNRVRPPKVVQSQADYLNVDQTKQLFKALEEHGEYPYVTLLKLITFTGMRRGEACGLEWQDIDFTEKTLSISRTCNYVPSVGIYTDTPKTPQSKRSIAFDETVKQLLMKHYNRQLEQKKRFDWHETDRLFTKPNGDDINPSSVTKYFHKFVEKYNLPECHVHSLRHTNASLLIAANTPITTVAGRLGHSDPSTTLRIYSHQLSAENKKAGNAIEQLLCV